MQNRIIHYIPGYISEGSIEKLFKYWMGEFNNGKYKVTLIVEKKISKEELLYLNKKNIEVKLVTTPKKIFKYLYQLNKILRENFDIIHCHSPERGIFLYFLLMLKSYKRKNIILHAHSIQLESKNKMIYYIRKSLIIFSRKFEFYRLACSQNAANYFFGTKRTFILKNGIESEKFKFDETIRSIERKKLNLEEKLIIGHIGRIVPIKNQDFLIDIFREIHLQIPETHLLLIGAANEEYKDKVIDKIKQYNLEKNVSFLGMKKNIDKIINAIDIIVHPSISEGFGITLIEAQVNGIKCFTSTGVPKEVKITNNIEFLSLNLSAQEWGEFILKNIEKTNRKSYVNEAKNAGYDILESSKLLFEMYKGILNENK